jgi:hypothetical protein
LFATDESVRLAEKSPVIVRSGFANLMGVLPLQLKAMASWPQSECIPSINAIGGHRPPQQKTLRAVAADRLDRATFHRLFAERLFFRRFGLFVNV